MPEDLKMETLFNLFQEALIQQLSARDSSNKTNVTV